MEIKTRGYHPKISRMLESMEFRLSLREAEYSRQEDRRNNRNHFNAALGKLKEVDPAGWEAWYDDPTNIPEEIIWLQAGPVIGAIAARISELTGKPFTWKPAREYCFDWQITRPAKRGKKRVTVTFLTEMTKKEFAAWWLKYRQTGWKAKVVYNPIQIERQLSKGVTHVQASNR